MFDFCVSLGPVSHSNGFNLVHGCSELGIDRLIIDAGVQEGLVDMLMPEEFLQRENGHALVDEQRRNGVPQTMGRHGVA